MVHAIAVICAPTPGIPASSDVDVKIRQISLWFLTALRKVRDGTATARHGTRAQIGESLMASRTGPSGVTGDSDPHDPIEG
jgi:hypothetical protein